MICLLNIVFYIIIIMIYLLNIVSYITIIMIYFLNIVFYIVIIMIYSFYSRSSRVQQDVCHSRLDIHWCIWCGSTIWSLSRGSSGSLLGCFSLLYRCSDWSFLSGYCQSWQVLWCTVCMVVWVICRDILIKTCCVMSFSLNFQGI